MTAQLREKFEDVTLNPGQGKITAFVAMSFGLLTILAACCFLFPSLLTTPELRPFYAQHREELRLILIGFIIVAAGCGLYSAINGNRYGFIGLLFSIIAALLGSGQLDVPTITSSRSFYAGFDYFVLTLVLLALVFIPMERLFPKNPEQKVLRKGWITDMKYFMFSHIGVQLIAFFTIIPVQVWISNMPNNPIPAVIQAQPYWLQFIQILIVVDFTTYWVHRSMHEINWLWRFHAIHHSTEHMDWLASSRLHIGEMLYTRFIGAIPIFLCGFSPSAVYAYLVFISFHAIFIHANVSFRFPVIRWLIATPEFHHWHHSSEKPAIDKNYAAFIPLYDKLFKTMYLPKHLASQYGTVGYKIPHGVTGQFVWPFKRYWKKWFGHSS